jgi:hypothetical protein
LKKSILFLLCIGLNSCFLFPKDPTPIVVEPSLPSFADTPLVLPVTGGLMDEASGVARSTTFSNAVWIIEDSGNKPGLHLLGTDGTYKKFVDFRGNNRDWEDLASGPGPTEGVNYVYVPDIGDNNVVYPEYYIYRFPEPTSNQSVIDSYETIKFKYPGGVSYNAETLLLDPKTKDLYVITKDQFNVRVYYLKYPQPINTSFEAEYLGDIPYFQMTAGDISPDGTEILLKNYLAVYYWKKKDSETIYQTLKRNRDIGAPYFREHQGESICWDINAKGYYTISERGGLPPIPDLYYYFKK